MTKKDYEAIAKGIKNSLPICDNEKINPRAFKNDFFKQARRTASYIADELQRDNARFNRQRFLKACGVGVEQKEKCLYCTDYPCSEHDGSKYE